MSMRIGLLGIGFMGKGHFINYLNMRGVTVAALCDVDKEKRTGDWSAIGGNIGGKGGNQDLTGIDAYANAEAMLARDDLDVIDITLPTHLHAEYAIKALKAGKHVICEKPMARTASDCRKMIRAAKASGKHLFVAHCIRYWPAYVKAREIIQSKRYGKVISASFRRLSSTPKWSWNNWLQDPDKSGACALDLHIHDTDFVLHTFGMPDAVTSHGTGFSTGRVDHIFTEYRYGDDCLITAEGAWEFDKGYPFSMTFTVVMEKATLASDSEELVLYQPKRKPRKLAVPAGSGYSEELKDFIQAIRQNRPAKYVTPASAMESVRLVEKEIRSVETGRTVTVKR